MPQREFLYQERRGGRIYQPETIDAFYLEAREPTGESLAGMRVMRGTGRFNRERIHLRAGKFGTLSIERAPDAVKRHLRRLRPQEAERLDEIDADIERLQAERRELMATAWAKGHVITLKEITDMADAHLAARRERVASNG